MKILILISIMCLVTWAILVVKESFKKEEGDGRKKPIGRAKLRYIRGFRPNEQSDYGGCVKVKDDYTDVEILDSFTDVYGDTYYLIHVLDESVCKEFFVRDNSFVKENRLKDIRYGENIKV